MFSKMSDEKFGLLFTVTLMLAGVGWVCWKVNDPKLVAKQKEKRENIERFKNEQQAIFEAHFDTIAFAGTVTYIEQFEVRPRKPCWKIHLNRFDTLVYDSAPSPYLLLTDRENSVLAVSEYEFHLLHVGDTLQKQIHEPFLTLRNREGVKKIELNRIIFDMYDLRAK